MAGEPEGRNKFSGLNTQVAEDSPLDDAKKSLIGAGFGFQTTFCPNMGALHGTFDIFSFERIGALIERHDDISAEFLLNLDRFFGSQPTVGAIDVALECDPVFIYFTSIGKRKNLVPTRISEDRSGPGHK